MSPAVLQVLQEIAECSKHLRHGGPDSSDLQELHDALDRCTTLAFDAVKENNGLETKEVGVVEEHDSSDLNGIQFMKISWNGEGFLPTTKLLPVGTVLLGVFSPETEKNNEQ